MENYDFADLEIDVNLSIFIASLNAPLEIFILFNFIMWESNLKNRYPVMFKVVCHLLFI